MSVDSLTSETAMLSAILYVEIVVREHPIFERDGAHLSCEVPVSFITATLGGSIEVPTLEGHANIKDLLKKFENALAADGKSHNPRQRSWLEGVRQFFGRMGN